MKMGSELMAFKGNKLKLRILRTGGLCLCVLILFQIRMKNENPVWLLFETVFPGCGYEAGMYAGSFLEDGAALIQQCLFPGAAYIREQDSGAYMTVSELYPTQADLSRIDEENEKESTKESEEIAEKAVKENEEARESGGEENTSDTQEAQKDSGTAAVSSAQASGTIYPMSSLLDYNFLMNQFFIVDSSTSCDSSVINPEVLLNKDLTMDLSGDSPKVLIYHTHSQETFADSVPGDEYGTVIGLGNTLTDILQNKYGVSVYHDKGVYDMIDGKLDRSEAYSMALPVVEQILADNPSIKVVIDLHRDGVNENTHLVTNVNGKPTAQIMFFNGLCRSATSGTNGYIQNPYLSDNLAFSLQLQLKAAEKYPDFTRRIYLRSYRYNMHVAPRTLLIECGAQTNTVEEVQNAMEPLADILYSVLSGI